MEREIKAQQSANEVLSPGAASVVSQFAGPAGVGGSGL